MFEKKRPAPEILPEDRVRLKPLLGIRPGVYLAYLYAFVLLLALFLILLYPGLSKPGSLAVLRSEPSGAAVRIDGVTMGATPCEVFIPRGKRLIELVLPGFESRGMERDIPGRVFASLFFPRREYIDEELREQRPAAALTLAAADYAAWSFTGEPTVIYQIPQSLSEGAYRSGPAAADPAVWREMTELLKGAARFASTRAALRDLLRSQFLIDNGGLSPSPLTLLRSASDILSSLAEVPGAAAWLADLLPPEAASLVAGSSWYTQSVEAAPVPAALPDTRPGSAPGGSLSLGSLRFRGIPGGTLIQGAPFPHARPVGGFLIAETEVSPQAWELFLAANPEWRAENTEALMEKGLVNGEYLGEPLYPPYPNPGVSGVSWHAAKAYCAWLTGLLPENLASWELRLPTEAEWEYAAKLAAPEEGAPPSEGAAPGPENMLGGLWEWCEEPFAPLSFFPAGDEAVEAVSSPERPLRGGSWINPPGSVGAETRASLPPSSCSPFVSFRPVIAPGSSHE
jgi:formylglycine-generating enzyme required for sulfatase activity